MSAIFYFAVGLIAWVFISRKLRAKRAADAKNWSVDFRNDPEIRRMTKRLPWKDL
jgi:hypothetical protein